MNCSCLKAQSIIVFRLSNIPWHPLQRFRQQAMCCVPLALPAPGVWCFNGDSRAEAWAEPERFPSDGVKTENRWQKLDWKLSTCTVISHFVHCVDRRLTDPHPNLRSLASNRQTLTQHPFSLKWWLFIFSVSIIVTTSSKSEHLQTVMMIEKATKKCHSEYFKAVINAQINKWTQCVECL